MKAYKHQLPGNVKGYLMAKTVEKEEQKEEIAKVLYFPVVCGMVLIFIPLLWLAGCR